MLKRKYFWLTGMILLVFSLPVPADAFTIDSTCSYIGFTVQHLGISKLLVRFNSFQGRIDLHHDDIQKSKFSITIKTNSLDSGNRQRDKKLLGKDFFNAKTYPEITCNSTRIESRGDEIIVFGELCIRGVAKEIEFEIPLEMIHVITDPDGKQRFGLALENAIRLNRRDFGMTSVETLENGRMIYDNIFKASFFIQGVK